MKLAGPPTLLMYCLPPFQEERGCAIGYVFFLLSLFRSRALNEEVPKESVVNRA